MHRKKYTLQPLKPVSNGVVLKEKESKEAAALTQFKSKIEDLLKPEDDDYYLTKWLKARQFDVQKAEDMFRTSMAYREKMKVDRIIEDYEPPEVLKKYLTGGFCGYDKEGSPVRVEPYGYLDMKGIMYSARKVDLEKTKLLQCEKTVVDWKTQSEKLGRRVDGITVIFDMEAVSTKMLWRPGLQMYLHLVKVLEDNYPEMMKTMFVVNAPRIFPLLYKICRPLISEDTKNKIHVIGGNFKNILLEYIDADQLPVFLGGTLTDPDGNPRCATMICQGGVVPETYYLHDKEEPDNMETVTIGRGDKLLLKYEVERPGCVLRWEFKTDNFDVGFGLFIVKNGENVPIIPVERVNSHMVPEDGSHACEEIGTYIICFDNSFSWARGKKMKYVVEIVAPDDSLKSEIEKLIEGGADWDAIAAANENIDTTKL